MIRLYQFPPAWGLPSASPFCLKLETYLRMAGIDYWSIIEADPRKAPLGKLPYIEDQDRVIADSGTVIEYLKETHGDPLDGGLSPEQRTTAHLVRRMVEENLYWAMVYFRWVDPAGWALARPAYFGSMPFPLRMVVPGIARAGVRKTLRGHGMGRHSAEEVCSIGAQDLQALSEYLGDKPYLTGEAPASVDACVYGSLAQILLVPVESPLKARARSLANLVAYCQRIRQRYFGD